jgi:hypothetical protein
MNRCISLDAISIATPCEMDWDAMTGDERVRFCGGCHKNVYNFAAMTLSEGLALLEATEGKVCGRISRRRDGTVITGDCPVGVAARWRKLRRQFIYGMAAAGLLIGSVWGWNRSRSTTVASPELQSDTESLVEKVEEWMDEVRMWAGLPPKRVKVVMMGGMCAPPVGKTTVNVAGGK